MQTVAAEHVRLDHDVAAASNGAVVVTWLNVVDGRSQVRARVRGADGRWSDSQTLSPPHDDASGVVPIAWGDGNVSVFWEHKAPGVNNWKVAVRTLDSRGRWSRAKKTFGLTYAFQGFGVAVADSGEIALSWEGGDHQSHVAVRDARGRWTTPGPIHVRSRGTTFQFISNPQATFISDDGRPQVVVWGHHNGRKGSGLWSVRFTRKHRWAYHSIGPVGGDRIGYDWVPESEFAADGRGDFAAVWSQQNPVTHRWTTLLRYRASDTGWQPPHTLGHARCDYGWKSCADVAMADDGTARIAWAMPGKDGQTVMTAWRPRHGPLTHGQVLYKENLDYDFAGVDVQSNAAGDATIRFLGGNHRTSLQEFARCPAGHRCARLVASDDAPSWLDPVAMAVSPSGTTSTAWVTGCIGEACAHNRVFMRRLAAAP